MDFFSFRNVNMSICFILLRWVELIYRCYFFIVDYLGNDCDWGIVILILESLYYLFVRGVFKGIFFFEGIVIECIKKY